MPATPIRPSAAVQAATARRANRQAAVNTRIQWFVNQVSANVQMTVRQRVAVATHMLRDKVVKNISMPVGKGVSARTGRIVVTQRSQPGEFPRADTTQLMKTIFADVRETSPGVHDGFVGTPLDYGLILETSESLDRSFLVRTLQEEFDTTRRVLTQT